MWLVGLALLLVGLDAVSSSPGLHPFTCERCSGCSAAFVWLTIGRRPPLFVAFSSPVVEPFEMRVKLGGLPCISWGFMGWV